MACTIKINPDKIKIKGFPEVDNLTETEFDDWLFKNRNTILSQMKDGVSNSPTFAINLDIVEQRKAKFNEFRKSMNSVDASVFSGESLVTMGTTTAIKYIGNANDPFTPVVTFKEHDKDRFVREQMAKGKTKDEIEQLWVKRDRLYALKTVDGSILGAMIEDKLEGTDKNIKEYHKGKNASLFKIAGVNVNQAIARIKPYFNDFYNQLMDDFKARHEKNFKIYTEVRVVSKELSPDFKKALAAASVKLGKKEANAIEGHLDIVVQDEQGFLHMYDIKLSSHPIQEWWDRDHHWKYDTVSAQQMFYSTMMRQQGQNLSTAGIIPALADYDDNGNLVSLKKETIKDFAPTNEYAIASERYFPVYHKTDSAVLQRLSKLADELYPGLQLDKAAQTVAANKTYIKKNIVGEKNSDGKYELPLDARFDERRLETKKFFDTEEELDKYLDEVYIPKMNEFYASQLPAFAKGLNKIIHSNGSDKIASLKELARGFTKSTAKQEWIINKFKKYALQGWDLVSDEENNLANYGIFVFIRNGIAEIVMLDKVDLTSLVEIGVAKNTTVLGNVRSDLQPTMDDRFTLKSLRGNLMAMKAMMFISQNENTIFNGIKVQAIKAMNVHWQQEVDVPLDILLENWNRLCSFYNLKNNKDSSKTRLRTLGKNIIMGSTLAYVNRANDIVLSLNKPQVHFKGHNDYLSKFDDEPVEEIYRYMANLACEFNVKRETDWVKHTDAFEAYQLLTRALLVAKGFPYIPQNGVGDIFSRGIFMTGARSSSPSESNSAAIRMFNEIEGLYEQQVSDAYHKIVYPWQEQMLKVYKEAGIDTIFSGGEHTLFSKCFEEDNNGNIDKSFCLIPPDKNRFLDGKQELKKLVNMFLEEINKVRIPDAVERENLAAQRKSVYYQVPLTLASTKQMLGQAGLIETVKQKAKHIFDDLKDFSYGQPMSSWQIKKRDELSTERVYDPYSDISEEALRWRAQQLSGNDIVDETGKKIESGYGVNVFERSLDTIFLRAMASATRAAVSTNILPMINGLRAILAFENNVQGFALDKVMAAIKDYTNVSIFGRRILDPDNETMYKITSLLRKVTSIPALALSSVAEFREELTNKYRTAVSKTNEPMADNWYNFSDYLDNWCKIIYEAPKNADVTSFWMQMNYRMGMANISSDRLAEQSKSGYLNFENWQSDLLFLTSTAPDFTNRNAILMAILKKRGSDKAYFLNESGELTYDMEKDDYFSTFYKYKGHYSEIQDDKTRDLYKTQETRYMLAMEEWNKKYGLNLKYGDKLPDSLTPAERLGIKSYADHLFGNYDTPTKSLLQRSLVGSLVLQFKTYGLQRFLQSFRDTGHINVMRMWEMKTDEGERIFILPSTTPEELSEFGAFQYVTESKLTKEMLTNAKPWMMLTGSPTGGTFTTTIEMCRDFIFDPPRALEHWKTDKVYRTNLYIALIDNLGMLIFAALLRLLYGEAAENIYDEGWWTRWSYTVLMGVAQDGPISQVISGLYSGTPPSISIIGSFLENAQNVINGTDSAIYGLLNSFGATRTLTGMFTNV